MDKAQILALADRVEALTGPDRGVDEAIFEALFPRGGFDNIPEAMRYVPTHIQTIVPRFTASTDAAMTLDPGEPWLVSMMHETGHAGGWRVELSSLANGAVAISDAGCDAARAFTAASLRAMVGGEDA